MLIKIDDKVSVNMSHSFLPREGKITDISIGLTTSDPAGELGVHVEQYETDMNYNGSIGYVTENGDHYWAYFSQIEKDI